jgi:snurportin-1
MASAITPILDLSSLSLYKLKTNSISSLANQNERRQEVLKRQKEKREQQVSQLRFAANENQSVEDNKPQWPPRQHRKNASSTCPIGMMLAEWLFSAPEDISSWFIIPCPLGQRCLVVVQSHRTHIYGKYGNLIKTMFTNLPKQTILYCIYDNRTSIYNIIDIIMWNGQDYSTQIECQCRYFMLMSLNGDSRLNEYFQILPRFKIEDKQDFIEAEDGYLFYHPLGFYESGYSPLVCWLKPFMIEEILGIKLSYPINKPIGYTTAQAYMFEEQSNRKEQQQQQQYVGKSHKKKKGKVEEEKEQEELMSVD